MMHSLVDWGYVIQAVEIYQNWHCTFVKQSLRLKSSGEALKIVDKLQVFPRRQARD